MSRVVRNRGFFLKDLPLAVSRDGTRLPRGVLRGLGC